MCHNLVIDVLFLSKGSFNVCHGTLSNVFFDGQDKSDPKVWFMAQINDISSKFVLLVVKKALCKVFFWVLYSFMFYTDNLIVILQLT